MISTHHFFLFRVRLLLWMCLLWPIASMADTNPPTLTIGAGVMRLPSWPGAKSQRNEPVPYLDIELPNGSRFSTLDGLQIDLLHGAVLHGGIYGDYQSGRDHDDLGPLGGKVASLAPRLTLGGYLEWQLTQNVDMGIDLSHDITGAGGYLNLYAEWDLPSVGLLQHSVEWRWQAMNAPAMNRFFGVTTQAASALQVAAWQPGAGSQLASLEYDLFVPTSQHTGFALALSYGRLLSEAGDSPLVTRFGSRTQLSESLAFVYHH